MKKILLLGGSPQQIVAIETAKKNGIYTVLCDYLIDNPGQYIADKFYLLSTTDKKAILNVAKKENIDGILAYASDPAAPTATFVAEKLHLLTNPYKSAETLCNKDKFRCFLKENGFNTPLARGYSSKDVILKEIEKYRLPVIIKPVDSSGSKGVTVIRTWEKLDDAIAFGFSFSRSHRIIIEEYIEKKHPYLIGGDIFIKNGKIVLWGLMNCHRDIRVNPLVPIGKSYPLKLCSTDIELVKDTLQNIVDKLHIEFGSMNVELIIDKNDRVWPIDIGPRAGGNMIPDLLNLIFNVDVVEMAVKTAMGIKFESNIHKAIPFYATHNLHTDTDGTFERIEYSEEIRKYIIKEYIYKKEGDKVEYFDNASKALGIVFFKFENEKNMDDILSNISSHIKVFVNK